MTEKLKLGFFGITGCAGCQLSLIFNEDDLVDLLSLAEIHAFPFIKEVNAETGFDYAFMEGLVASENDLETLKRVRQHSKFLVALGACAHTGCVPAYRTFSPTQHFTHLLYQKDDRIQDTQPTAINRWVHVDYTIPGCPPSKPEIIHFIKSLVLDKMPRTYQDPVCVECRRNGNPCLLDEGKPCLGPITRGGCNSVCTNAKFECWGCRGHTADANLPQMIRTLREKGFSSDFIKERMKTFVGAAQPTIDTAILEHST